MALIETNRSALASADDSNKGSEQQALTPQAETIAATRARRGRQGGKPVPAKRATGMGRKPSASMPSKTDIVLKKLRLTKGVTIAQLVEATGWQAHSVRGFLSAVIRKKLGHTLLSEIGKDGIRRYRTQDSADNTVGRVG